MTKALKMWQFYIIMAYIYIFVYTIYHYFNNMGYRNKKFKILRNSGTI